MKWFDCSDGKFLCSNHIIIEFVNLEAFIYYICFAILYALLIVL